MQDDLSVSGRLREAVMSIMDDGETRKIPVLKGQLLEKNGLVYNEDYGDNHLTGVLGALTRSGFLERAGRGTYKKTEGLSGRSEYKSINVERMVDGVCAEKKNDEKINELEEANAGCGEGKGSRGKLDMLQELKNKILTDLNMQYNNLVREMDTMSLSSVTASEARDFLEIIELKDKLKDFLSK